MNQQNTKHVTVNVMEELVLEEVTRQLKRLSPNLTTYINQVEVATFALNRLPALYASSHKGLNQQKLKAKTQHSVEITRAVRQGFAAVQKDVLRYSTPIVEVTKDTDPEITRNQELEAAKQALSELAPYFPQGEEVSWTQLVKVVKPILEQYQTATTLKLDPAETQLQDFWGTPAYHR